MRLVNTIDSPVLTPRVKWEGPGLAYFGYEGITGDQLARRITTLSSEEKTGTGVLLGQFLQRLHSAELPGAPRTDLKTKIEEYRQKYLLAKPALIRAFSEREVQSIEHFLLVELADGLKRLGSDMRLCHSDLGPWNIILTPEGEVGVIDFGDVGYEDPAIDFSGFGSDLILQAAFKAYGADDRLRQKAALRIRALPILDIPFYLGKHDEEGVKRCTDLVRRVIIEGDSSPDARFTRG